MTVLAAVEIILLVDRLIVQYIEHLFVLQWLGLEMIWVPGRKQAFNHALLGFKIAHRGGQVIFACQSFNDVLSQGRVHF